MNLISCGTCGVVLDKDKLNFPDIIDPDDYTIDTEKAVWNGEDFISKVNCPICKNDILEIGEL